MAQSSRPTLAHVTRFAQRIEDRLTWPVIVAALASIPAVFLTIWNDGEFRVAGLVLGWSAGAVLWAETAILLLAAHNKRVWLATHKWTILVCLLTFITLAFALGGGQILRLISLIGSMRILRAKRIFSASMVIQRRLGLNGWVKRGVLAGFGILTAAFVAVVLADPTARHVDLFTWIDHNWRIVPIVLAGAILAFSTWLVVKYRSDKAEPEEEDPEA
ncbi:hypothetical protein [Salininema proteolyticum]|uniref:Uncharacterized protein n=1 Tax=Salininema proteolyticum TaxID=1607685 RepID=A0ABV8U3I2_9ACTN